MAGIAHVSSGTLAIFFGAYISTKAQRDFFENQIERERQEIEELPQKETEEIRDIFRDFGFKEGDLEIVVITFLFILGIWKTKFTKAHWFRSGIETLIFGGVSCGIGFLLGRVIIEPVDQ